LLPPGSTSRRSPKDRHPRPGGSVLHRRGWVSFTSAVTLNNAFGDTLKERRVPSIWVLVGGDDTRELSLTVANLTQGTEKRIDIDRMINVLDASDSTTGYLGDWRRRRNEVAFLLRHLDVRLFELTPNVAVSAIRAFGDQAITDKLN